MTTNPLFPSVPPGDEPPKDGFVLDGKAKPVEPPQSTTLGANSAAEVIRKKLQKIYADEPSTAEELKEVEHLHKKPSKHQAFMAELSSSGRSLAEIQTEWHHYYVALPDDEKHAVWREFYENAAGNSRYSQQLAKAAQPLAAVPDATSASPASGDASNIVSHSLQKTPPAIPHSPKRTSSAIKRQLLDKVSAGGKLQAKHHLQSLLFGFGVGAVVLIIFLFSFFNEVFLAPFIHPSGQASATPIILDPNGIAPTGKNEVIIPKINLEIPVDYSQNSTDESVIENALESGVVHYPTTVLPGQKGNAAFFGHSSNNIFNPGKYKFAFVLLHTIVPGDTFYLTKDKKIYVYKVISRKIVDPSDVSVLDSVKGQVATATLITCDPPGTSLRRLVVVGQQISPSPTGNSQPSQHTTAVSSDQPTSLPGNGPTLLGRFFNWLF